MTKCLRQCVRENKNIAQRIDIFSDEIITVNWYLVYFIPSATVLILL